MKIFDLIPDTIYAAEGTTQRFLICPDTGALYSSSADDRVFFKSKLSYNLILNLDFYQPDWKPKEGEVCFAPDLLMGCMAIKYSAKEHQEILDTFGLFQTPADARDRTKELYNRFL